MRFHAALGVDFKTWTHTKMERENNMKEFKGLDEEMPRWESGTPGLHGCHEYVHSHRMDEDKVFKRIWSEWMVLMIAWGLF